MTHRGDSDWHGWPLQEVTDRVAQAEYARMRETWPETIRNGMPDLLVDVPKGHILVRQIKETVLPHVVAVLNVVNTMEHPVVTELRTLLLQFDTTLAMPDQADDIAYADLVYDVRAIAARGQED